MKVTIKVPIVRQSPQGSWEKFQVDGSIELEGSLADISKLKEQANDLLVEAGTEYKLVRDAQKIEDQISHSKRLLEGIREQINVARGQLARLGRFLKSCGVDPQESALIFRERLLELNSLNSASVDTEECGDDPIPFDDF